MTGPINITGVRNVHSSFLRLLGTNLDESLEAAGRNAPDFVRRNAGFKRPSGKLAAATESRVIRTSRGATLILRNKAKHAWAQEKGSGIHAGRGKYPIRARRAKALRFMSGGGVVFRRAIMHPGVPATRFLYRATLDAGVFELRDMRSRMVRIAGTFRRLRA